MKNVVKNAQKQVQKIEKRNADLVAAGVVAPLRSLNGLSGLVVRSICEDAPAVARALGWSVDSAAAFKESREALKNATYKACSDKLADAPCRWFEGDAPAALVECGAVGGSPILVEKKEKGTNKKGDAVSVVRMVSLTKQVKKRVVVSVSATIWKNSAGAVVDAAFVAAAVADAKSAAKTPQQKRAITAAKLGFVSSSTTLVEYQKKEITKTAYQRLWFDFKDIEKGIAALLVENSELSMFISQYEKRAKENAQVTR